MDKKELNDVLWALDHVFKYIKTYGKNTDIFDPNHSIMHLENVITILKNQKNEKEN